MWSPRHSYVRGNVVDVEIPKEMNHFGEVKTFTEHVGGHNERSLQASSEETAEQSKTDQWNGGEAKQKQRSTTAKRRKKNPNWKRRSERKMSLPFETKPQDEESIPVFIPVT